MSVIFFTHLEKASISWPFNVHVSLIQLNDFQVLENTMKGTVWDCLGLFGTVSLSAFGFLKHLNEHCNERGRGDQSQLF